MKHDISYLDLLLKVLNTGTLKKDRTGTGTLSIFGSRLEFDVSSRFPLLTTKKMHIPSILHELLWFISGDTNTKYLTDNNVRIWNEWADNAGDLGPVYGKQWRAWEWKKEIDGKLITVSKDQLQQAIVTITNNPNSRRILVNSWNVSDLDDMALPPCHLMYQFYVEDNVLSLQWYQRSVDVFLGLPFNIASYAALLYMVSHITGMVPGKLIFVGGDTHLYINHIEQAKEQISRTPYDSPQLRIVRMVDNISNFNFSDFQILNYEYHPTIKAPISV